MRTRKKQAPTPYWSATMTRTALKRHPKIALMLNVKECTYKRITKDFDKKISEFMFMGFELVGVYTREIKPSLIEQDIFALYCEAAA